MCFGPSLAERQAAEQQRVVAEEQKQQASEERAERKATDIEQGLSAMTVRAGRRGGSGRRSLLTGGASGYFNRF